MELIFVRHAEPNYAKDGLTEKGKKEALLLSDMLVKEKALLLFLTSRKSNGNGNVYYEKAEKGVYRAPMAS